MTNASLKFIENFNKCNSEGEYECLNANSYVNVHTKLSFRHKVCGHEFESSPTNILAIKECRIKTKCPKCASKIRGANLRSTLSEFLEKLVKKRCLIRNQLDFSKSAYVTSDDTMLVCCKLCTHEFNVKPKDLLEDTNCPKCNFADSRLDKVEPIPPLGLHLGNFFSTQKGCEYRILDFNSTLLTLMHIKCGSSETLEASNLSKYSCKDCR